MIAIARAALPESEKSKLCFTLSAKWLMEGDRRFDATAYASGAIHALDLIEKTSVIKTPLSRCVSRIYHPTENQPRSNFRRIWVDKEHGTPFLSGRQLFHFRPEVDKYISNKLPKINELRVPTGTILLTRSGTLGIPVLVSERLSKFAVTDDALRIFAGGVPCGYIYAFLASQYGYAIMARSAYGSTVEHLEAKHLATIPVPMAPGNVQQKIHNLIIEAYRLRDHANDLLDEADKTLHEALGLDPFDEKDVEYLGEKGNPKAFMINAAELGGRFDASNHVPIARSVLHKLEKCRVLLSRLGDSGLSIFIPARFKRNYVEIDYGVTYLIPSQITLIRPYGLKYLSPSQAAASPEYLLQPGELLVSTDGTIGRLHVVTKAMQGWFGSNNLARLRSSTLDIGFLYSFLATPYGQHQICREIYGGVIDHISEKQLADVLIPMLEIEKQKEIG